MTFVMGTCCWIGDVGSFTKACVVVLFVLEGICVVSYAGGEAIASEIDPLPEVASWEGFNVYNWCLSCSSTGMTSSI